ncbi:MAG: hypothetical protein ACYS17_09735 [Planctomycetota bacterium]|jgi:FtsZ-binding cell division protein ZapB
MENAKIMIVDDDEDYTNENNENLQDEISDLRHELEQFQKEKERVRAIIGKIGGVPKFRTKLINVIFIFVIAASV